VVPTTRSFGEFAGCGGRGTAGPDEAQIELCAALGTSTLTAVNIAFTLLAMIRSFADLETERFYTTGKSRRLPPEIRERAAMRLTQLNAATQLADLKLPPSNRLEALRADRKGQWSVRINDQWRLCFRFSAGDAFDVAIVDYH
jgi:toxin HigB-1